MSISREVVLDTETTGLEPYLGHRIIEIGAVELINRIPTGRKFHSYLNPSRDVPKEAYRIHGISTEFLKDKPKFNQVVDSFIEFIADAKLVIHNAPFDIKFLNSELTLIEKPCLNFDNVIDTLPLARSMFPGARVSLDALCKRLKIDNSLRQFHGALLDALLLTEVYIAMMGGRQGNFAFAEGKSSSNIESIENMSTYINTLKTKVIKPTTEELKNHSRMLDNIVEPFWKNLEDKK